MRDCMQEVEYLLRAKIQCIWIDTYEEDEAIKDLREVVNNIGGYGLYVWSSTEGLKRVPMTKYEEEEEPDRKMANPIQLFNMIESAQRDKSTKNENVFVMRDLHLLIDAVDIKRKIRDLKEYSSKNYNPIVVISPVLKIPVELEKLFTVVNYDVPDRTEVQKIVRAMARQIQTWNETEGRNIEVPTETDQEKLVNACLGLTFNEIKNVFAKSIKKYGKLSLDAIMEEKIQLVKKSGVLDYTIPKVTLDDIGGNHAFKEWIYEVEDAFTEEAKAFGLKAPKGYMALGIPGCSKSMGAEAIASRLGVPFLRLNMSKIMSKLVGESERKIEQAFRVAKACAPCVLLIDEIEKALGGIRSSNASDAGTTARVFGKVLENLNEETGIFTIMTSNDVSQLPPELTRAGRLDAIWYFGLPSFEERKEIFRIHLGKTGKEITEELIEAGAMATENFTGAEIEEVVKVAMRKAFKRFKETSENGIREEDLRQAANEVIPIFNSSREKILTLENWVRGRARYASKTTSEEIEEAKEEDLIDSILRLER